VQLVLSGYSCVGVELRPAAICHTATDASAPAGAATIFVIFVLIPTERHPSHERTPSWEIDFSHQNILNQKYFDRRANHMVRPEMNY